MVFSLSLSFLFKQLGMSFGKIPPVYNIYILLKSSLLQTFKAGVDPKHIDVESLNQQAGELTKDSSPEQAVVLKEPLAQLNVRWGALLNNIGDRQVIWICITVDRLA